MKKYFPFLASLLSGVLLSLGWPVFGYAAFLFVALVPMLWAEDQIAQSATKRKGLKVFFTAYAGFMLWNLLTTWWVVNASLFGAIAAFVFNTLFMALVFLLFHKVKQRLGVGKGMLALICFWITFEFIHINWELSWPWLTLGNGFATSTTWIQWYEYTGVFGGSFWILLTNTLLYHGLTQLGIVRTAGTSAQRPTAKTYTRAFLPFVLVVALPIYISHRIYVQYQTIEDPMEVVVVQPNIDPYNEKFTSENSVTQITKLIRLANLEVDSNTSYVIGPETAISESVWAETLPANESVKMIWEMVQHQQVNYIIGLNYIQEYATAVKPTPTARKFKISEGYYDIYNTAMQLDIAGGVQLYHKSKLVPGVERMPYPSVFGVLEHFAIDLGGTSGSLATQADRTVFLSPEGTRIAPSICYESVYGEFMSEYVRNGAQVIFIITNDGWWGDTPGYKQHMNYGRLRAIEARRDIARSANTGISCFIDQRGDIHQATNYWEAAVIKQTINRNNVITFYARHGDFIARICMFLSAVFVLLAIVRHYIHKNDKPTATFNNQPQ